MLKYYINYQNHKMNFTVFRNWLCNQPSSAEPYWWHELGWLSWQHNGDGEGGQWSLSPTATNVFCYMLRLDIWF